jgi:hypothetical protein
MNWLKYFADLEKAIVYDFQGRIVAVYQASSRGNGLAQAKANGKM